MSTSECANSLNNENYKDTLLQAVNLGYDTDTTACIVGGLAGIYYGYEEIPNEVFEKIRTEAIANDGEYKLNEYKLNIWEI